MKNKLITIFSLGLISVSLISSSYAADAAAYCPQSMTIQYGEPVDWNFGFCDATYVAEGVQTEGFVPNQGSIRVSHLITPEGGCPASGTVVTLPFSFASAALINGPRSGCGYKRPTNQDRSQSQIYVFLSQQSAWTFDSNNPNWDSANNPPAASCGISKLVNSPIDCSFIPAS